MIALLLATAGLATLWLRARSNAGIDFYQMWVGPRMARETTDFYAPATRARMGEIYLREAEEQGASPRQIAVARYRRDLEVLSTPLLYTVYAAVQADYERSFLIFHILVFASFVGWVVIFARLFSYDILLTLLIFGFLTTIAEPPRSDATVGNMNHIMIALLALAALATARRAFAIAGAILAIATLIKPYVILTIPVVFIFLIASRRWRDLSRHAAGAAAAGTIALVASSAYFRTPSIWLDWLDAFRAMPSSMIPLEVGNFALAALNRPLSIGIFVVALIATIFAASRRHGDDILPIVLGCVLFQFVSPLVWVHHLLLSVPLILWLLRPGADRRIQIAGAIALALLAVEPWGTYVPTVLVVAIGVNVGLAVAFAAAIVGSGPRLRRQQLVDRLDQVG